MRTVCRSALILEAKVANKRWQNRCKFPSGVVLWWEVWIILEILYS